MSNDFVQVIRAKHGIFMFNRNDKFIGRSLGHYGEWCESEISLLQRFIKAGDTVMDVGANIGTHTVAFSKMVGESGSVLVFEPQRLLFQLLCGNVAINCLTNVRCLQKAAGYSNDIAKIPALSPHESHNFGAVSIRNGEIGGENVEVVTIDSLALKSCRLIKIDVEGMEPEVIGGALNTIATLKPILFVENNTVEKASRTLAAVIGAGYRVWWHLAL